MVLQPPKHPSSLLIICLSLCFHWIHIILITLFGHNLAIFLKNKGNAVTVLDSLGVNNLLSFTDSEIINQKLYRSILNERPTCPLGAPSA